MGIKTSKFRSETNKRFTKQLFWDLQRDMTLISRVIEPMFSLHDDVEGCINFRKEYIRDMDPSGYKTATRLLENYDHWKLLMKSPWFREAKKEWDEELQAKQEAEAMEVLREIMKGGDDVKVSEQIAAAKAVLAKTERSTKSGKPPRGRPTTEEVEGQLKEEARLSREEQEDAARIQLVRK